MTTEQKKRPFSSATSFEEVGRIPISDKNTIVISRCYRGGDYRGVSVNKYVTSEDYTGFSKGTFIPEENIVPFLKLFDKGDLQDALNEKGEST